MSAFAARGAICYIRRMRSLLLVVALTASAAPPPRLKVCDNHRFLCTAEPDAFRALGTRFLQMPLDDVRHVDVVEEVAA